MTQQVEKHKSLKYRPDVDGLRAVAVLSVLAMHLGSRLGGGFVGVDVFFVISGYLISATILSELAADKFSIVSFYERRVRRIFPAMLVMMAAVTLAAYFLLVPSEVEDYARSLVAALFSGSNLLFWHDAGYFDGPSQFKPLLHTWSLGVEEQFYILFPIFLILLRKFFPGRLKLAILSVTVISFVWTCLIIVRHPAAAFFFAPLRAWELLIGTIASQHYLPQMRSAIARNVGAVVGIFLIGYACIRFTAQMQFPGWPALLPCVGAALIIAAGEQGQTSVGKVLAWKPIVFIGLISYSLYLWHWPLIVFQRTNFIFFPTLSMTGRQKLILAVISIVLGTLSWKFVEQPFRKGRFRPGRIGVFVVNGVAMAVMTIIGVAAVKTHGFPGRFPPEARAIAEYTRYDEKGMFRAGECFVDSNGSFSDYKQNLCLATHPGRKSVLVMGDSHAAHLVAGLKTVYPDRDILQATLAGCAPLLPKDNSREEACQGMYGFLYNQYLKTAKVDLVVVSGRWNDAQLPQIGEAVAYIKSLGLPVVLVGPGPEFDVAEPRMIAMALRSGHPETMQGRFTTPPPERDKRMAELARDDWHVPYISIFSDLCSQKCPLYAKPGVPFLFDTDHMTVEGSTLLAQAIRDRNQLP